MRSSFVGCFVALLAVSGCVGDAPTNPTVDAGGDTSSDAPSPPVDGGGDVVVKACDVGKPFGAPVALQNVNSTSNDAVPRLTPDELTIVFSSDRPRGDGGSAASDLYIAQRSSTGVPFNAPVLLDGVSSSTFDSNPSLTADGLALYFDSDRSTVSRLYVATRANASAPFASPSPVTIGGPASSADYQPFISPTGGELWFARQVSSDLRLFHATASGGGAFGVPVQLTELSSPVATMEVVPTISADGLRIFWASNRPDGNAKGDNDVWTAARASTSALFASPQPVPELNSPKADYPGWVSPDGCRMYFSSYVGGTTSHLYLAQRP